MCYTTTECYILRLLLLLQTIIIIHFVIFPKEIKSSIDCISVSCKSLNHIICYSDYTHCPSIKHEVQHISNVWLRHIAELEGFMAFLGKWETCTRWRFTLAGEHLVSCHVFPWRREQCHFISVNHHDSRAGQEQNEHLWQPKQICQQQFITAEFSKTILDYWLNMGYGNLLYSSTTFEELM